MPAVLHSHEPSSALFPWASRFAGFRKPRCRAESALPNALSSLLYRFHALSAFRPAVYRAPRSAPAPAPENARQPFDETRRQYSFLSSSNAFQPSGLRFLFRVVRLVVCVVGRTGVMHALSKRRTKPVFVGKSEIKVIRPARVSGDKQRFHAELFQARFQFRQGANRQLVVLRQRGNEAVPPSAPNQIVSPVNRYFPSIR